MTRIENVLPEMLAHRLPASIADRRANWIEVARTDIANAARSMLLLILCGLFIVVTMLAALRLVLRPGFHEAEVSYVFGLGMTLGTLLWLALLTGLLIGYSSIAGIRETGSLRVLLGLPVTRRDILIGTFLGRSVVFSTTLLIGLAVVGAGLWYFYVDFDLGAYMTFVGLTVLYGVVAVAMGVGFSALFRSRSLAMAAAISVFALLVFAWRIVPKGIFYLQYGQFPKETVLSGATPPWLIFLWNANPTFGYLQLVQEWATRMVPGIESTEIPVTASVNQYPAPETIPFYLQPEFVLVVLVLWGVVPLVVGSWRFCRSDLG